MKKFFSFIAVLFTSVAAMATDYTCPLVVSVGDTDTDGGTISVSVTEQSSGLYTLSLKNFVLASMPIGTITMENVSAQSCGVVTALSTQQTITIANGDDTSVPMWLGPNLGEVPIKLYGEIKGDALNAILSINMSSLGGVVGVKLGSAANELGQLPNSGFENFHTASFGSATSEEPNSWHSFMSSTGGMSSFVSSTAHTFISEDVRDGATGTKSVMVTSSSILSISANGTITTGRLKAGSITAASTDNNSFLDFTNTATDANGDPFYAVITNKPDAISVWVKYHAGASSPNPYASVNAVLTDGTYYQDPENQTYTNVVAKATNTAIASNGEVWQQVTIPFDYDSYASNGATPKAMLVTISTCATPAGGSTSNDDPDALYIDDISLIYNTGIESITVNGTSATLTEGTATYEATASGAVTLDDIVVTSDGQGAIVEVSDLTSTENGQTATIMVTSNDLKTYSTYKLNITNTTGIDGIDADDDADTTPAAIYNISGQKVKSMDESGVYIIKQADGKAVKVLKK